MHSGCDGLPVHAAAGPSPAPPPANRAGRGENVDRGSTGLPAHASGSPLPPAPVPRFAGYPLPTSPNGIRIQVYMECA